VIRIPISIEIGESWSGCRRSVLRRGGDLGCLDDHELLTAPQLREVVRLAVLRFGTSLSPDASAIYYVQVDRASMTDAGRWRLPLAPDAEPEQVIQQVTPATYDFASQYQFAWSPDGDQLVAQYCNRQDCLAHVIEVGSGESQLHDEARVFELRGATDTEYIADAMSGGQRMTSWPSTSRRWRRGWSPASGA
jgi:hypothetical protein